MRPRHDMQLLTAVQPLQATSQRPRELPLPEHILSAAELRRNEGHNEAGQPLLLYGNPARGPEVVQEQSWQRGADRPAPPVVVGHSTMRL